MSSFFPSNPLCAQLSNCAAAPIPPELEAEIAYPDCSLASYDLKCIRVKFHYLDNDPLRPSNAPGDAYFFDLLQRMNNELEEGKIRLTFDYNCIHRGEIEGIESSTDISNLIDLNDASVDFDPDAINVYFMQDYNNLTPIGSNPNKHVVVGINSFPLIMHEVGHALGARHTFPGFDGDNLSLPPSSLSLSCKDITVSLDTNIFCELAGDNLCDTGIDPLTHDLDGDSIRDGYQWVDLNTCAQSAALLPSIPDGCNDTTTQWNIPVRNYMSYYGDCRSEFSPCQYGRMHEAMSAPGLASLILNCEEDPFGLELEECSTADITISTIVTWTNETKLLCPGQKIIITPSGHLVLDNTILTRAIQDVPLETRPSLFYELLWDGIYIEGRGANVLHNGAYYHLGGLTVKNGSIIEYSKSGIQGLKGYGKVEVVNSTLRHNRRQFALRDSWPFTYPSGSLSALPPSFTNGSILCDYPIYNPYPSLIVNNSSIEVGSKTLFVDPIAPTQIMVDQGNATFINTEISNNNNGEITQFSDITAIKHARGKLSLINGTVIDNFKTGVFKSADVYNNCSPRGLYIHNSTIKNTITAVHTTTQFVSAKNNFFKGNLTSEGLSYSNWFANRFKKGIPPNTSMMSGHFTIQAPEKSYLLSENLFDYMSLDFYRNNRNSSSVCNTWESMNLAYAVVGEEFVDFPSSWGTPEFSAGNRHNDGEDLPKMFSEDQLINYADQDNDQEEFEYEGLIISDGAGEPQCTYDLYPEGSILFDSLFSGISVNNSASNSYWLYLDSLKTDMEGQIPGSPIQKQKLLQEQIDQIEILKGDLVRNVLSNLTSADESIEATWLSRSHPGLIEYSELLALWYSRDYDKLDSIVSTLSDPDAETLLAAIEFVAMCSERDLPIDSLPAEELDTLAEIVQLTFGNYSNIIRNYLNMAYDRPIFWPVTENGLIPRSSLKDNQPKSRVVDKNFIISPNPSNGCFYIKSHSLDWHPATYQLFSSTGSLVQSGLAMSSEPICITSDAVGLYLLRIITIDGNIEETHKILIQ